MRRGRHRRRPRHRRRARDGGRRRVGRHGVPRLARGVVARDPQAAHHRRDRRGHARHAPLQRQDHAQHQQPVDRVLGVAEARRAADGHAGHRLRRDHDGGARGQQAGVADESRGPDLRHAARDAPREGHHAGHGARGSGDHVGRPREARAGLSLVRATHD